MPIVFDAAGEAEPPYCAPVYHNGNIVGLTVSAGWSYILNKSIALAYVRADLAKVGTALSVQVIGEMKGAVVGTDPLFDPTNARLRG